MQKNSPVAVITGASRGLGAALAHSLAQDGWQLVLDARDHHALDLVAPVGAVVVPGDVTDPGHRQLLVEASARLGGANLLVNNASTLGASPLPPLDSLDLGVLRTTYEVNVVAPLALIQAVLPFLTASKGTIVNVTSDAAVEAYEGWGGYGSSKAALEHLSAILAAEHPELRVRWVDPGDMRTEMHQDAFPGEDISDRPVPESVIPQLVALLGSDQPSGRARLAEVAP